MLASTLKIGLVNSSTSVKDVDLWRIARACNRQIQHTVAPAYNKFASPVQFWAGKSIPKDWAAINVVETGTDASTLGWHSEAGGRIIGEIDVATILSIAGASVLGDTSKPLSTPSVSSVISHEVCETFIDPNVQLWADGPKIKQGSVYAFEPCDPVESGSFFEPVDNVMVQLSDVVFPAWFDSENVTGPFNHLGDVKKPFTMSPGGYMVVRNGPGSEQEVFGETFDPARLAIKNGAGSRRIKRGGVVVKPVSAPVSSADQPVSSQGGWKGWFGGKFG